MTAALTADHDSLLAGQQIHQCETARMARQQVGVPAPTCTTFRLPVPPSVNEMFKNLPGRGRGKTAKYRDWILEASVELKQQTIERIAGNVILVISVERDSLSADIDNRVKAILDLLVQPGLKKDDRAYSVLEDDSLVTGLAVSWAPRGPSRRAWARIAIMSADAHALSFHPSPDGATGGWFIDAPGEE